MKLSVICPSINPDRWVSLIHDLKVSAGDFDYELICVGPSNKDCALDGWLNFKYIQEYSCPSRSFQVGALHAEGEYIAFVPDDIRLDPDGFKELLEFADKKPRNHGYTLRYNEGPGNQSEDDTYWTGRTHDDQKLKGIKDGWKIAPCFMYKTDYFFEMGGLDCSMEHVNLNAHSLAYLTQAKGGKMHLSPTRIFCAGWSPPTDATILYQAYLQNDKPKFTEIWDKSNAAQNYNVSFDNWRQQPYYWPRRYGKG
jgi:glycosyltransferase involved in cell wall biosynthesis